MQWILLWIVVITIALGWKYPLLGFSVPVVMLAGLVGSLYNGRYVCGNLCPRGGFFDRIMSKLSRNKGIPKIFRNSILRGTIFFALMGFMFYRLMQDPLNIYHWGYVFWVMCVITTAIGVALALIWHPRGWCSFCPMGTMQSVIGGGKNQLEIDADACVKCGLCEKNCPFDLTIYSYGSEGHLPDRDCLKCSECVISCPKDALQWPGSRSTNQSSAG